MIDNNSSSSSSFAANKAAAKPSKNDGADYSHDDTRALLHALQSELRAGGAVGPSGIHMMSHKFLFERRTSTANDTDQDQNKQPSALVDFIFPPRAKGMITRAGTGGAHNGKKQEASTTRPTTCSRPTRQGRYQPHPKSSSSSVLPSSPFLASFSSFLGEEIADMIANESASSQNAHSAESIKKEHDENLAAAREYAATMRRLSTIDTDDIKLRRKPRQMRRSDTNSSASSTSRSRSRNSSFGNLANTFVDAIESALNDLSEEATGTSTDHSTEFITNDLSNEEHNFGTELQELRKSRDRSPETRRNRSPSTVAARGA